MFVIHCEVWGGVTGHRQSLLKHNNVVIKFDTLESAEREANRMNQAANSGFRSCSFSYRAEEMKHAEVS